MFGWEVEPLAVEFAHRLEERGLRALVLPRSGAEIGDVLIEHGLPAESFELVEAQALSRDDATAWSRELADRIADRIEADG